jgi:uncharacterized protein involved in outer membrane biogenesis
MNRILKFRNLVALVVLIIAGAWISYVPILSAGRIQAAIEKRMGRSVTVAGGAGYVFSPVFGIGLHDVSMVGAGALAEPVAKAKTLIVPSSVWQVLSGQMSDDVVLLDGADINIVLNAEGRSNVMAEQNPASAKTDARGSDAKPIIVKIHDGHFRFHDERSNSGFEVTQISGDTQLRDDGSVNAAGSAVMNEQFVNYQVNLASLQRSLAEGSPIDLNVDGVASTFAFTGRLATNGKLNLAGQADVGSTDLPRLLKWLGMPLKGFDQAKTFSLSGALDANGSVFQLKNASVKLASMTGKGDVEFDASGERPRLKSNLGFDQVDLNLYQTAKAESAAASASWTEQPIELSDLNALDAELAISTNKLIYNGLQTGPATLEATLVNRVLHAELKSQALAKGTGEAIIDFDAAQLPPKLQLDLSFQNVEAKSVLDPLFSVTWLSGPLTLNAKLSAAGDNQAALLSNLSGTVQAKLDQGSVTGVDLGNLTSLASKDGSEGWLGGTTSSMSADLKATLNDGVATLGDSKIEGAGVSLTPQGEIDVLRKSLDLTADAGLPVKLQLKGPWQKPKIYADLGSVLENPKAVKKLLGKLIGN